VIPRIFLYLVLLTLFLTQTLRAQITQNTEKLNRWQEKYEAGIPRLSVATLPVYNVDHGFALSAATGVSFKTRRNNNYLSHSFLPLAFTTNFKDKHAFAGRLTSYWFDDILKLDVYGGLQNRRENYWGIGMEGAKKIDKRDNSTEYHKNWTEGQVDLLVKLYRTIYGGVVFSYNAMHATDLPPKLIEDPFIFNQGSTITNAGFGFSLKIEPGFFESPFLKNALLEVSYLNFSEKRNSDFSYQKYYINYRHAMPAEIFSGAFSWQVVNEINTGEVPWSDMASLGGEQGVWGIPEGKYRDKSMSRMFLEYAYIFGEGGNAFTNRHETFIQFGGGTTYGHSNNNQVIYNMAAGYRFLFQPSVKMQFIIGIADGYVGTYLGFLKSF
jgi:hypothetical protein